ncbi:response regulator transcription factor [Neobacillus cucumis]|uniref:DNA-binding response regulator n=1 Tax=Neobacillus cucumis TaxID=1740721 RepID=A0A2N5H6A9_9BACI|nr:response regulator [Neobacillus cucumis]PLS01055.1 hypothetical protein CVD27_27070 [Neobacillus cucumis]
MKTIIVEDEYHIRQGIKESIEWEALSAELVGEADNGEDAWELYQACQADLILLDINMPKMNGLELAKRIRSINDKAQIVFLTGFDEFNYVKQAITLNASDYLLKPISYQELKEALIRARNRVKKLKEHESMVEELKQTNRNQSGQMIPYKITAPLNETSRPIFTKELELLNKVKTGVDFEESFKGWMEGLTLKNFEEAKMIASQFCFSLFRIVQEEKIHFDHDVPPFIAISQCNTLKELTAFLSNIVQKVAQLISEKKELQGNKIIEDAKRWIREHLSEDVSLVRISDHLHLSPNYFSQLFKQETGETFISYTTNQRFERSKELLRDNRLKIAEIATQVGYTDTNYFSIAFRKFYGVTPSEYRKRL